MLETVTACTIALGTLLGTIYARLPSVVIGMDLSSAARASQLNA